MMHGIEENVGIVGYRSIDNCNRVRLVALLLLILVSDVWDCNCRLLDLSSVCLLITYIYDH